MIDFHRLDRPGGIKRVLFKLPTIISKCRSPITWPSRLISSRVSSDPCSSTIVQFAVSSFPMNDKIIDQMITKYSTNTNMTTVQLSSSKKKHKSVGNLTSSRESVPFCPDLLTILLMFFATYVKISLIFGLLYQFFPSFLWL